MLQAGLKPQAESLTVRAEFDSSECDSFSSFSCRATREEEIFFNCVDDSYWSGNTCRQPSQFKLSSMLQAGLKPQTETLTVQAEFDSSGCDSSSPVTCRVTGAEENIFWWSLCVIHRETYLLDRNACQQPSQFMLSTMLQAGFLCTCLLAVQAGFTHSML